MQKNVKRNARIMAEVFAMESKDNTVTSKAGHESVTNMEIKVEPWWLEKASSVESNSKPEEPQDKIIPSSLSQKPKRVSGNTKTGLKDEPIWMGNISNEAEAELEESPVSGKPKDSAPSTGETDDESEELQRLSTEAGSSYSMDFTNFLTSVTQEKGSSIKTKENIPDIDKTKLFELYTTSFIDECGQSLSGKKQLEDWGKNLPLATQLKHYNLVNKAIRPYECKVCDKSFLYLSDLKKHALTHEDIRLHKCDICDKSYKWESSLKVHKLFHDGKRPFGCEICGKDFLRKCDLEKHDMTHQGLRPYTCNVCNKSFTQSSNLRNHSLIHEGKRPHKCESCQKSFVRASHLKTHSIIHEGKRPYKCDKCNKTFAYTSVLRAHKLVHEPRLHKCEVCQKEFTQEASLKRHKTIHTKRATKA